MRFVQLASLTVLVALQGCSTKAPEGPAESAAAATSPGAAAATAPGSAPAAAPAKGEAPTPVAPPGSPAPPPGAPGSSPPTTEPPKAEEEEPKPPEQIEVNMEALEAGLKSPLATEMYDAAEYFRRIPAGQRREVLAVLSTNESASVRANAWRTFATLATKEDIPTAMNALQSPHSDVRIAAIELMATFPNEQTIGVMTKLLENPDYREMAVSLLTKIGPACEPGVLPYASHADASLRVAAWKVLADVGTRQNVKAFDQLRTREEFKNDPALKRTIERLHRRLSKR